MANNHIKASRQERARQFMPFASLRGYYDIVREQARNKEPKRELAEDELSKIYEKIKQIKKGMMLTVTYYNVDSYEKITGIVSNIDETSQTLTIVKTKIPFDNILDIEFVEFLNKINQTFS